MRGLFAVAGAASIAASSAFVSPAVDLAANVLTVTGYTSLGSLDWEMSDMMQGAFCSPASGNTCEEVEYLSGVPNIGESSGLWALRAALASAQPPTMVVGFSQGAMIATDWILRYGDTAAAPSPSDLSFVMMANPLRKYGGVRPIYGDEDPTPADTAYRVLDIAREYDGAADVPDNLFNLLAVANAIAGFSHIHINGYDDVDLDTAEKLVWIDGNTTYVLIRSQNIPLLEPLRNIGLDALADALNDPLKAIIDSAYDRDYVGMVDPDDHDEALAGFPHASGAETVTTAARLASAQSSAPDAGEIDTPDEKNPASGEPTGAVPDDDVESDTEVEDTDENDDATDDLDDDSAEVSGTLDEDGDAVDAETDLSPTAEGPTADDTAASSSDDEETSSATDDHSNTTASAASEPDGDADTSDDSDD